MRSSSESPNLWFTTSQAGPLVRVLAGSMLCGPCITREHTLAMWAGSMSCDLLLKRASPREVDEFWIGALHGALTEVHSWLRSRKHEVLGSLPSVTAHGPSECPGSRGRWSSQGTGSSVRGQVRGRLALVVGVGHTQVSAGPPGALPCSHHRAPCPHVTMDAWFWLPVLPRTGAFLSPAPSPSSWNFNMSVTRG